MREGFAPIVVGMKQRDRTDVMLVVGLVVVLLAGGVLTVVSWF